MFTLGAITQKIDAMDCSPWASTAGRDAHRRPIRMTIAQRAAEPFRLYTDEERARRDASGWTLVQGILAPVQFVVFAVSLALVLRYHTRMKESEIHEKVDFFLEKFRLFAKSNSMPSDLSAGEKKLVGFARAVVNDPDILILDEPTALIDKKTKRVLLDIIEEYKEEKKTIFMTSSDTELIFNISDLVGVIMDGTLKTQGEPYEIKYSDQKEVKELLSNIKVIKEEQIESEILDLIK